MKQLSKFQSALFLLGGVLMVIGAASFAFGFINKQIVLYTCWLFLVGNVLFSVVQAMQIYEGPSLVIHRLKRMQYIADIFFVLSGISMVDTVYAFALATGLPTTRPISRISITNGWYSCLSRLCWNSTPRIVSLTS